MPLKHGTTKKIIYENTREMIHAGYPPKQAYAAANRQARSDMERKINRLSAKPPDREKREMAKPSAKRISNNIKKGVPRGVAILEEYARVGRLKGYGSTAKRQLLDAVTRHTGKRK